MPWISPYQVARYPVILSPVSNDQKHSDKDHDERIFVPVYKFEVRQIIELFCRWNRQVLNNHPDQNGINDIDETFESFELLCIALQLSFGPRGATWATFFTDSIDFLSMASA